MKTQRFPLAVCLVGASLVLVLRTHAQNLVTNPGFESGNMGFTTDYALWTGGGIGQNRYVVTNNPQKVEASWNSAADHTSGSGQMLVVDGSTNVGRVFWRQAVPVTTNSTYIFSAWTLKFESQPPPILYFTINGIQQGTFYVLPVAPSDWQGYGVSWNSGASNIAQLELRLQSNAGFGNNIAVDDVSFVRSSNVPSPQATIEAAVQIGWPSYPGASYQVQWRSVLDTNVTWLPLGSPISGNGGKLSSCDPLGTNGRRFYQILLLP